MIEKVLCALSALCFAYEPILCLQQNSYRLQKGCRKLFSLRYVLSVLLSQASVVCALVFGVRYIFFVSSVAQAAAWLVALTAKRKIKFKLTKRAARLFLCVLIIYLSSIFVYPIFLHPIVSPFAVCLAWALCLPLENLIISRYARRAERKLALSSITKIAVVGSYGKTEVKKFLQTVLPSCVATPSSVNTLAGVSAFINNTDFSAFKSAVFEMGARRKGDLARLCRLVKPTACVFCGIAACHMETFKSIENVIAEKTSVFGFLSEDGVCVFNNDDAKTRDFSPPCIVVRAGESGDVTYSDVTYQNGKTLWTLSRGDKHARISSAVLGRGAVCDVTLACALALQLGESFEVVCARAENVAAVEHRLNVTFSRGVYVVDDSYNANPVGVKNAAEAADFFNGKKAVITQGIAEGGKFSHLLNVEVGKVLSAHFDLVAAVGENAKDILSCCENCVFRPFKTLEDATKFAVDFVGKGGMILYQNDLPD